MPAPLIIRRRNPVLLATLIILANQSCPSAEWLAAPSKQQTPDGKQPSSMMEGLEMLKSPVSLPDLPVFSGETKFIGGQRISTMTGRAVYHMMFFAQDDPQAVLKFYKNALVMNRWNLSSEDANSISAEHNNGHKCTITVSEADSSDGRTMLGINYEQIGRMSTPRRQ